MSRPARPTSTPVAASGRKLFSPRLVAVVTAFSLLGGALPARADFTLEQLLEIERLISNKNCAGLWTYVRANPGFTEGNDPLAAELRNFVSDTERGKLTCFDNPLLDNSAGSPGLPDVAPLVAPIY